MNRPTAYLSSRIWGGIACSDVRMPIHCHLRAVIVLYTHQFVLFGSELPTPFQGVRHFHAILHPHIANHLHPKVVEVFIAEERCALQWTVLHQVIGAVLPNEVRLRLEKRKVGTCCLVVRVGDVFVKLRVKPHVVAGLGRQARIGVVGLGLLFLVRKLYLDGSWQRKLAGVGSLAVADNTGLTVLAENGLYSVGKLRKAHTAGLEHELVPLLAAVGDMDYIKHVLVKLGLAQDDLGMGGGSIARGMVGGDGG